MSLLACLGLWEAENFPQLALAYNSDDEARVAVGACSALASLKCSALNDDGRMVLMACVLVCNSDAESVLDGPKWIVPVR